MTILLTEYILSTCEYILSRGNVGKMRQCFSKVQKVGLKLPQEPNISPNRVATPQVAIYLLRIF